MTKKSRYFEAVMLNEKENDKGGRDRREEE